MKENNKVPDIIIDDYQEIKYINKIQPKGWNKLGLWVGFTNTKSIKKKRVNPIIKDKTIDDYSDINLVILDGVTHIYSMNNNYFNNI